MEEYTHYDKGLLLRDRYLKVADISQGSYGLVSVAKDVKKDNRLVAVKFIYPVDFKRKLTRDHLLQPLLNYQQQNPFSLLY